MAGTVTATERISGTVRKLVFAWTSDGSGDADGESSQVYDGEIVGLTTIPDGTAVPTVDYDVVVNDAEGHDVLLGAGADRSATVTEHVARASLAAVAQSTLTLVVSNAGAAKQGTVILYVR